jgi:hypothetical protein
MPRFKGNLDLLGAMQDEYDKSQSEGFREQSLVLREQGLTNRASAQEQSLAIRQQQEQLAEQQMGFREEHVQQMEDLAQKAAAVHDEYISMQLARQQTTLDHQKEVFEQTTGAWKAVSGLDPKTQDYPATVAGIAAQYPAAFATEDSGLHQHIGDLDKVNAAWSASSDKAAQLKPVPEAARMAYIKMQAQHPGETQLLQPHSPPN